MSRVHMDENDGNSNSINCCLLCGTTAREADTASDLWCFRQDVAERGPRAGAWCTPDHPLAILAEVHAT